jgi:hypothetical protein
MGRRPIGPDRHLMEEAQRLNRLLRFLDRLMRSVQHPTETQLSPEESDRLLQGEAAFPPPFGTKGNDRGDDALGIEDLAFGKDDIARLARFLQDLSGYLDVRFRELYGLLQLTQEINKALLLDDVLEKAYDTLRSILRFSSP